MLTLCEMLCAFLAMHQRVKVGSSDSDRRCSQGNCLNNVCTALESSVNVDLEFWKDLWSFESQLEEVVSGKWTSCVLWWCFWFSFRAWVRSREQFGVRNSEVFWRDSLGFFNLYNTYASCVFFGENRVILAVPILICGIRFKNNNNRTLYSTRRPISSYKLMQRHFVATEIILVKLTR